MKSNKIRFSILFKLVFITGCLLLATVVPITYENTKAFKASSSDREKASNRDQAKARSTEVENLFVGYIDKVKIVASLLLKEFSTKEEQEKAIDLSFRQKQDLVTVEVLKIGQDSLTNKLRVVNEDYLKQYELDKSYLPRLRMFQKNYNRFDTSAVFSGQIEIRNSSTKNGAPLISIGVPFVKNDIGVITHIAIAEIPLDRLQKVFSEASERKIYLIDRDGALLAHPDENQVFIAKNVSSIPIVESALKSTLRQKEIKFTDEKTGENIFGVFSKTSLGITVIAQVSESVILELVGQVQRDAVKISGQIFSLALFLIFLFSMSITSPIDKLVDTVTEVAKGNFKLKSNIKTSDEVGMLGSAIDNMIVGLEERDKVKNVLNKFHGSAITDDLLKGELELGGSNKEVTVFFSDIRDFTKFSEGHTPEEVVQMLNEYFKIMVSIINKNHGVVDKFIGDAIMAVWGAPQKTEADEINALTACIQMRTALDELNQLRIGRDEVPIKVGIGIHTGRAISGTIGSDERMEYTVIGDAVNTAARIEASTKAFGTDLLISGETLEIVKEKFITEPAGEVEVKGKSEPLRLFKVKGYINENGEEVLVETQWSDYEAGHDAKVKIAG